MIVTVIKFAKLKELFILEAPNTSEAVGIVSKGNLIPSATHIEPITFTAYPEDRRDLILKEWDR